MGMSPNQLVGDAVNHFIPVEQPIFGAQLGIKNNLKE